MYKTLVIAPKTDLEHSGDEVMAVVNALSARLLTGQRSNITGLLDIANEGWDIVWLCTHGDDKGIYLLDGLVPTSELTTLVRSAAASLTVMNTCSSYPVAHAIHNEIRTNLVCTIKPVPDREAFVTGTIFARQLAKGYSFYDAYELAKPGQNSTYTFLGTRGNEMPPMERGRDNRGEQFDAERVLEALRRMEKLVDGDPTWNITGLVPAVRRMEEKIDIIGAKMEKLEQNQKTNRIWIILLTVVCALLLIAVVANNYMLTGGG